MKPSFLWFSQVPKSFHSRYSQLAKGISGADRREKQRLMRQLSALRAELNMLDREKQQVCRQLSLENRALKVFYDEIKAERDDLQLEIWELEDLIEELLTLLAPAEPWPPIIESTPLPAAELEVKASVEPDSPEHPSVSSVGQTAAKFATVDLSGTKLALVGGHGSTRQRVISELQENYGLTRWVELPPFSKHSLGRSNIKAKIHDCDLIVLITGYMKHKQTDSIVQLKRLGTLPGAILLLNCRGKSGVVREILTYISENNC